MAGVLYLVATPIGNLEDMTYRAVRILNEVDLIAAEDTRNSIKLLNHFEVKTPMTSYHEHNKYEKAEELVAKLESGTNIAVITDAGTPGISDPGEELVRLAYESGITVVPVPGACAAAAAIYGIVCEERYLTSRSLRCTMVRARASQYFLKDVPCDAAGATIRRGFCQRPS